MSSISDSTIPVALFAFARPEHTARVLETLRNNKVGLLYAYADNTTNPALRPKVDAVRQLLRAVDWCDVRLVERTKNLGLGRNVRVGVGDVLRDHACCVVWEDDLIAVPGTYSWVCAALRAYANETGVMSISAWTHPRVTPADIDDQPYLDARAECWVWGTWARAWAGMEDGDARQKMATARQRGTPPDAYGADLPEQARREHEKNTWAVRWLYHHFAQGGLCVRPPWSMVEHIGFDASATNAAAAQEWANPPLRDAPPIPSHWPELQEHPACRALWAAAVPARSFGSRVLGRVRRIARAFAPSGLRHRARSALGWRWFRGRYSSWAEAQRASTGYDSATIVERVLASTLAVQRGEAAFERDGVTFTEPADDAPLLHALQTIANSRGGKLRVLDFGGALGSTYWRHRAWLDQIPDLVWDVVEQPVFVQAGREHLAPTRLRFFASVEEAGREQAYDVLLVSCVVQYLENPAAAIASWLQLNLPWLLLNNTPLHDDGPDRLTVQYVPPSIYPASYPVWFFNREKFLAAFEGRYELVESFASEAVWPLGWRLYPSTGLLFRRAAAS